MIDREAWGAAPPREEPTLVPHSERDQFMVHYSTGEELGRRDTFQWVREIQAYHQGHNGWSDVGYNYLVDREGRVFIGRGRDAQGAHCSGSNRRAIGVCFLGDDDPGTQDATPAARAAIRSLHAQLEAELGRDLAPVGHRDGFATSCPGDELYGWVHAGMPARGGVVQAPTPSAPRPTPTPARAPRFPLPQGWYFGPKSGPRESVSGYYGHRADLRRWQDRMRYRGWSIAVDGLWGPQTEAVARAFQEEKGLGVDGRVGVRTWTAAWTAEVTR